MKLIELTINQDAIEKDLKFAGFNLLVTSETEMSDADIYQTYHNLWRMEESFKIMKSDLDARPVFLQKEETIKGHFLICYLTVLVERIFQFKVLENTYSAFIIDLAKRFHLPLTNYFLSETQIKSIINHKF